MNDIEQRLSALGIALPTPAAPVANYVPFTREGRIVHISGQLSLDETGGIKGTVGDDVDVDRAQAAARLCAINLVAQLRLACEGDLARVAGILKLNVFVQAAGDFIDIPKVANGASDLLVDIFGDKGRHARSAVGVYRLPLGFAVEADAVFTVD